MLRRTLRLMDLMPAPGADALFIRYVGVSEGMRGQGLGTVLLEEQLEDGAGGGLPAGRPRRGGHELAGPAPLRAPGLPSAGEREREDQGLFAIDVPQQRRMELLL